MSSTPGNYTFHSTLSTYKKHKSHTNKKKNVHIIKIMVTVWDRLTTISHNADGSNGKNLRRERAEYVSREIDRSPVIRTKVETVPPRRASLRTVYRMCARTASHLDISHRSICEHIYIYIYTHIYYVIYLVDNIIIVRDEITAVICPDAGAAPP